jgi:hypothetical protein
MTWQDRDPQFLKCLDVRKQKGVLNKTAYMHQQLPKMGAGVRYEDATTDQQQKVDILVAKHPVPEHPQSLWDRSTVAMTMDVEVDPEDFRQVLTDAVAFVQKSKRERRAARG